MTNNKFNINNNMKIMDNASESIVDSSTNKARRNKAR